MAPADKLIDKRLIGRYVRKGLLDLDEYQRVLNKLPDRSENIWKPEPEVTDETANQTEGLASAEVDRVASDRIGSQQPALRERA